MKSVRVALILLAVQLMSRNLPAQSPADHPGDAGSPVAVARCQYTPNDTPSKAATSGPPDSASGAQRHQAIAVTTILEDDAALNPVPARAPAPSGSEAVAEPARSQSPKNASKSQGQHTSEESLRPDRAS